MFTNQTQFVEFLKIFNIENNPPYDNYSRAPFLDPYHFTHVKLSFVIHGFQDLRRPLGILYLTPDMEVIDSAKELVIIV